MHKKLLALTVILLLTALGAVPAMAKPGVAAKSKAENGIGTLFVKNGQVELLRSGKTKWIKAKKGMLLFEGDRLKTRELARAAVIIDDGSIIRLNENTDLFLKVRQADKKKNRIKLLLGHLWAKVKKLDHGQELEIETPSAVAAIKGTELELKVLPDGKVRLIVWDGLVDFFNSHGKVVVRASQESTSEKDRAPEEPKKANLESRDQWFGSVVDMPSSKTLKLKIKDKDGKEQKLDIKYEKK